MVNATGSLRDPHRGALQAALQHRQRERLPREFSGGDAARMRRGYSWERNRLPYAGFMAVGGILLKKAPEYHLRADEWRALAAKTSDPAHKGMLAKMAETSETLAQQREALVARKARIAELDEKTRR